MDEALDQVADGFVRAGSRRLVFPIYLPPGLAGGFITVTLGIC